MDIAARLAELRAQALARLAQAATTAELDQWRVQYLGRRGPLNEVFRALGSLPAEERPAAGQAINALKAQLEAELATREAALKSAELAAALERERLDVTLAGRSPALGGLHPTTLVVERIVDIFRELGFQVT